jgi:hypothetical protein
MGGVGGVVMGGAKTRRAEAGGAICVDGSGCVASWGGVCVGGASGAVGVGAIAGGKTFSERRLSGFSLTDAMSSGLVVFSAARGRGRSGFGAAVVALVANDRAGTEAGEGGVAWGAATWGRALRGMEAVVVGGRDICGSTEA